MSHNNIEQIQDLNETPIPLWRIPCEVLAREIFPEDLLPGTHVEIGGCKYLIKAYSLAWNAYIAKREA